MATAESEARLPAESAIGHVHLHVGDIDRALAFYQGILGFDLVTRQADEMAFVSAGGYHHHIGLNTWQGKDAPPPPRRATGLYHFAILYPTRRDLAIAVKRLLDAGWPIDGTADHGTHEALYLRDPFENGIELAWDRPPEQWPKTSVEMLRAQRPLDIDALLAEAGDATTWPDGRVPAGTRIGHVHLKVSDLPRSVAFYRDVIGFDSVPMMSGIPSAAFMAAGNYHHHLGLNTWESRGGPPQPQGHTGLYHFAITYPTRRDLARAYQRLLDHDVSIDGSADHTSHEALYLHDPDGIGIELAWDREPSAWQGWFGATAADMPTLNKPLDLASLLAELDEAPSAVDAH